MLSFLWSGSVTGEWGVSERRTWEAAPAKRYLWLWARHRFTPLFCLHVWTLLFHSTARDKIHENLWIGQMGLQRHWNILKLRSILVMSMLPALSSGGQAVFWMVPGGSFLNTFVNKKALFWKEISLETSILFIFSISLLLSLLSNFSTFLAKAFIFPLARQAVGRSLRQFLSGSQALELGTLQGGCHLHSLHYNLKWKLLDNL